MVMTRKEWEELFIEKMKTVHKRNIAVKAKKMLRKIDNARSGMATRSKKYDVECSITLDDMRQLALEAYGTECVYTQRVLTVDNMVFDHKIPISKKGPSTKENIQVISKFGNNLKGSLEEDKLYLLLEWLEYLPEDLRKDVTIRMTRGKN